jgi:hypothetical protein
MNNGLIILDDSQSIHGNVCRSLRSVSPVGSCWTKEDDILAGYQGAGAYTAYVSARSKKMSAFNSKTEVEKMGPIQLFLW